MAAAARREGENTCFSGEKCEAGHTIRVEMGTSPVVSPQNHAGISSSERHVGGG